MAPEDLADLFDAKLIERGHWTLYCPVCRSEYRLLHLRRGHKGAAELRCFERCKLAAILKRLGLTWKDYSSDPDPAPDHTEMDDRELAAYHAAKRERQAQHHAVCEKLRAQIQIVDELRRESKSLPAEKRPQRLVRKFQDARLALDRLRGEERSLRAPCTRPFADDDSDDDDSEW